MGNEGFVRVTLPESDIEDAERFEVLRRQYIGDEEALTQLAEGTSLTSGGTLFGLSELITSAEDPTAMARQVSQERMQRLSRAAIEAEKREAEPTEDSFTLQFTLDGAITNIFRTKNLGQETDLESKRALARKTRPSYKHDWRQS